MLSINKVSKYLNVTPQTVRNYIKTGKINATKSTTGRYYIEEAELSKIMPEVKLPETWAYYIRSSSGSKNILNSQLTLLKECYPEAKFIFKDSASGLNEKRKGLTRMIEKIKTKEITDIAITQRDRLSRFGTSYLEELFEAYNVKLHILHDENKEIDAYDELMKDFMSLITSFSGRFYRLRSKANSLKLLEIAKGKLESNESNEEL